MGYTGRIIATGIVGLFNILRYFYYHQYYKLPFEMNFFVLTSIFFSVAWLGGWQYDRAKYHSEKDALTDLYNRRTLDRSFQKLSRVCKRTNKELGVILIDIDHFKEVNDQLGHKKGDELLQNVSTALKKVTDKKDIIARWGGDEFLILVPSVHKENFKQNFIQSLQKELAKDVLIEAPFVGVSVGSSFYPTEGERFEQLVQLADTDMYKMKQCNNSDSKKD